MQKIKPLTRKVALITGATSGIGYHTASGLAQLGATVYVTGRDPARGCAAEQQLRARAGHERVFFLPADAGTVRGNQRLAERVRAETGALHILVNNVGGLYNDRQTTADGYEATLAMSFVAPFALTQALLPLLRASAPARIVNVASAAHALWRGDPFAELQLQASYLGARAYARGKLLEILWTFELARRLEGTGVVANALHPGLAWTTMTAGSAPHGAFVWMRLLWPLMRWMQRRAPADRAAATSIFLASAPEAEGITGAYFGSDARPQRPSKLARDRESQARAWDLGVELTRGARTATHRRAA